MRSKRPSLRLHQGAKRILLHLDRSAPWFCLTWTLKTLDMIILCYDSVIDPVLVFSIIYLYAYILIYILIYIYIYMYTWILCLCQADVFSSCRSFFHPGRPLASSEALGILDGVPAHPQRILPKRLPNSGSVMSVLAVQGWSWWVFIYVFQITSRVWVKIRYPNNWMVNTKLD